MPEHMNSINTLLFYITRCRAIAISSSSTAFSRICSSLTVTPTALYLYRNSGSPRPLNPLTLKVRFLPRSRKRTGMFSPRTLASGAM